MAINLKSCTQDHLLHAHCGTFHWEQGWNAMTYSILFPWKVMGTPPYYSRWKMWKPHYPQNVNPSLWFCIQHETYDIKCKLYCTYHACGTLSLCETLPGTVWAALWGLPVWGQMTAWLAGSTVLSQHKQPVTCCGNMSWISPLCEWYRMQYCTWQTVVWY